MEFFKRREELEFTELRQMSKASSLPFSGGATPSPSCRHPPLLELRKGPKPKTQAPDTDAALAPRSISEEPGRRQIPGMKGMLPVSMGIRNVLHVCLNIL